MEPEPGSAGRRAAGKRKGWPAAGRRWLAAGAGAVALGQPLPAIAQKIATHHVWTSFHKPALFALGPQYTSYSVEYDLGLPQLYRLPPPALPGLAYVPVGGDLALLIKLKGVAAQLARDSASQLGGDTGRLFYARAIYGGDIGYRLTDPCANAVLKSFDQGPGQEKTRAFNYRWDLETYLANAYAGELTSRLLRQLRQRVEYTLADHTWAARVSIRLVEGEAQAYQEISKSAAAFEQLLAVSPVDTAQIRPLVAVWEAHFAKADCRNAKAEINSRVALALLENLCAARMVLEDYAGLAENIARYESFFPKGYEVLGEQAHRLAFEVEKTFLGPTLETRELSRNGTTDTYYAASYWETFVKP